MGGLSSCIFLLGRGIGMLVSKLYLVRRTGDGGVGVRLGRLTEWTRADGGNTFDRGGFGGLGQEFRVDERWWCVACQEVEVGDVWGGVFDVVCG
jgi:hypothetical protein